MQRFIEDANIRLFEAKLAETTDSKERTEVLRLLAAEKAKPVPPANDPGPSPCGKREE